MDDVTVLHTSLCHTKKPKSIKKKKLKREIKLNYYAGLLSWQGEITAQTFQSKNHQWITNRKGFCIYFCLFCRSVFLLHLLLHHHRHHSFFVYFPASLHLCTAALESKINTMWSVASRLLSFPLIVTRTSMKGVWFSVTTLPHVPPLLAPFSIRPQINNKSHSDWLVLRELKVSWKKTTTTTTLNNS